MHFCVILATSLIVFIFLRLVFIFLYWILAKVVKLTDKNIPYSIILSISFLLMYLQGFMGAVQGVIKSVELTMLEQYFVFAFIGIASILWAYFSWDLKIKALPAFNRDAIQTIIKKIIVFFGVMIFSLYFGYITINKLFMNQEIDILVTVTNATIIPAIIAFDRLLNQVANYFSEKNKMIESKC